MAPPRTYKTAFLADVILRYPGPVIATTTKPDIYALTAAVRDGLGPDGRDGPDQRHELGDVVAVAAGQGDRQRDAGAADTHSCGRYASAVLCTGQHDHSLSVIRPGGI